MKTVTAEISDSVISQLVDAGLAEKINLFDAVITDRGFELIQNILSSSPSDSRFLTLDFTATGGRTV